VSDGGRLARALSAIDDRELRARKAAAILGEMPAPLAVAALSSLLRATARHSEAVEAVQRALHGQLTGALADELRAAAASSGEQDVLALLSSSPPSRAFDSGDPGYVDREMASHTLGHRKQLARGHDRDLLMRLAHDQDPSVVRQLLENPRITEREVLIAASRRPTHTAVLEEVFRSRRWSSSRRVRKALALNPYSPPALASAVLSLLTGPDLREVLRDENVRPEVRARALRLLSRRSGK